MLRPPSRLLAALVFVLAHVATSIAATSAPRILDVTHRVTLRGNVHPNVKAAVDLGAVESTMPMERMILALKIAPEKQAALDKMLAEQQDRNSPNYHKWLTPEEFGTRFGLADEELAFVANWLTSQGFTIDEVGKGKTWINFSGNAAAVESAFQTTMRRVSIRGQTRFTNTIDPSIPRGLEDLVHGVVSLNDFPIAPAPLYTAADGSHYMAPADFTTIYNAKPIYEAGIDGAGVSIAIVGRTNPSPSNWATFRAMSGLSVNPPTVIVNGPNPGDLGAEEDLEADLDVEWSGGVAKNSSIKFITSKSTATTNGVFLSMQYAVDQNVAPIISASFGLCESMFGTAGNAFLSSMWSKAASQGISVFVSSGDSGAAGCDDARGSTGTSAGVNGIASTPYTVAVGGTQFNEGSGTYWTSSNGPNFSSAIGYIPEVVWNESALAAGGANLWSTGGGVSAIYAKPSWQSAPGVPADGKRDVPDVALTSAGHDGFLVYTQGKLTPARGTSAAAPAFAGIMALIVQASGGQRQGNPNPRLYQLAILQYGASSAAVFHDIVSGNNSVPGVTGYAAGPGYDLATGLGSVNVDLLVRSWQVALPGTPTIGAVTPGNASVSVAFTPGGMGEGTLVGYMAACTNGSAVITGTGSGSPITVSGLTNGTAYFCAVRTQTSAGYGGYSSLSSAVTPVLSYPDLVVSGLSVTPSVPQRGPIFVTSTATNQGPAIAGAFRIGIYISANSNLTNSTLIASCSVASLAAGGTHNCSGALGLPTTLTPGNYYLAVMADDQQAVTESNGSNNMTIVPLTITAALPNYSDSWWNANESGWGITITDHGSNAFIQWYTYDQTGHNQKYVISGGTFTPDKCSFTGAVTQVTGPSWTAATFDPSQVVRRTAGSATINFCPSSGTYGSIIFSYNVDGVSSSKTLVRLGFGNDVPSLGGAANTGAPDFTDLWWNSNESGWGVSLTQHGNTAFYRVFTYDTDRRPLLFIVSGTATNNGTTFAGNVTTTTGPYFGNATFDPNAVTRTTSGTATITFADANNGTLTYTVNGVTKAKAITRLAF